MVAVDQPAGAHVFAMSDGTDRIGQVLVKGNDERVLDEAMSEARSCLTINGSNLEDLWRK